MVNTLSTMNTLSPQSILTILEALQKSNMLCHMEDSDKVKIYAEATGAARVIKAQEVQRREEYRAMQGMLESAQAHCENALRDLHDFRINENA